MGKPSEDEFKRALAKAAEMRERGDDSDFVAKSLLSLNYRYELWQQVIGAVKLYLHSGNGATEHAHLVKAIEKAEQAESGDQSTPFGLT